MNFYKIVTIIAIVILIIFLTITGVVLNNSEKKIIFPPYISMCPDYYVYDEVFDSCNIDHLEITDDNCKQKRFFNKKIGSETDAVFNNYPENIYNNPGMGPNSGICEKKNWAIGCDVHWDGITNNDDVCHKINTENLI